MRILHLLIVAFLVTATITSTFAQKANPESVGTAKGIVRDTVHNYVLKSATISVYKHADSTLLSYQITNNYGEFFFRNLPLNTTLKVEVSHVGYERLHKTFVIPANKNSIDLQTLIIKPRDITLKDVVVTLPPVSMNGDTLEFNAAAFKLDSNAVVEDLLRKIPNITLWGDGLITVNGREVKSVLVNGKPFFGGDAKVATQNIAKNALEKVQVYNTVKDKSNPQDSTLEMNLKLKKGKDSGYFGKIGAGYGTDTRFETDASINFFSPKMQIAVVGANNNINKTAGDIRTLVANSTFKGVGTSIEYQPDFREPGLNKPGAAGFTFNYNFIEKPTYDNKKALTANYFIQDKNSENLSERVTTTSINDTDIISEQSNSKNNVSSTNQRFDSNYEWRNKNKSLMIGQSLNLNRGESNEITFINAANAQSVSTSSNNAIRQNNFDNSNFNLNANYRLSPNGATPKRFIKWFNAAYYLSVNENNAQTLNITEFKSFVNSTADRNFNRKYDTRGSRISQQFNIEFNNLNSSFFGNMNLAGIEFSLVNKLNLNNSDNHNEIQDLDITTGNYINNSYLTNRIKTNVIDEAPGLVFSKYFYKHLSNRYYTNLRLVFSPQQKFIYQDNQSDRSFQNIKHTYTRFLPDASVSYSDNQYGEYYRNYTLNFSTNLHIPNIQQLAPLTDSTNLYYLQKGNLNLKEAVERSISFNFDHYDQTAKNTLNYNFQLNAGMTDNSIADSILIDEQSRRVVYLVNADGNKYMNFRGDVRKTYKLKESELQMGLNVSLNATKKPGYTNGLFSFSNNSDVNSGLSLNYTYKNFLAVAVNEGYSGYKSKQKAFNTEYSGKNIRSSLSASCNITKKLTLSSNINFNSSSSAGSEDVNFTIWNASTIYRFLKGNNAEFKFSALDLLRQNNSVINYGSDNSFTVGMRNVLQHYFMTTLSYYPRQFGKKTQKK